MAGTAATRREFAPSGWWSWRALLATLCLLAPGPAVQRPLPAPAACRGRRRRREVQAHRAAMHGAGRAGQRCNAPRNSICTRAAPASACRCPPRPAQPSPPRRPMRRPPRHRMPRKPPSRDAARVLTLAPALTEAARLQPDRPAAAARDRACRVAPQHPGRLAGRCARRDAGDARDRAAASASPTPSAACSTPTPTCAPAPPTCARCAAATATTCAWCWPRTTPAKAQSRNTAATCRPIRRRRPMCAMCWACYRRLSAEFTVSETGALSRSRRPVMTMSAYFRSAGTTARERLRALQRPGAGRRRHRASSR